MIRRIQSELRRRGFDLCHPIDTSCYNDLIRDEGLIDSGALHPLPEPPASIPVPAAHDDEDDCDDDGSGEGEGTTTTSTKTMACCNAILIGNTKGVWPHFLNWLSSEVDRTREEEDSDANDLPADEKGALGSIIASAPFDTFVVETITRTLRRCCRRPSSSSDGGDAMSPSSGIDSCELFWSDGGRTSLDVDDRDADDDCDERVREDGRSFLVSMTRVATTTGEYWNDVEATKLCVHPKYGTWTAFRAVVVFDATGASSVPPPSARPRPSPPPPPCPSPMSTEEIEIAKIAFERALGNSSDDGGRGYGTTVGKPWEELRDYLHGSTCAGTSWEKVPDDMKPWILLRDCVSAGRREGWKYDEAQLLYHYTRDREILIAELRRVRAGRRRATEDQ